MSSRPPVESWMVRARVSISPVARRAVVASLVAVAMGCGGSDTGSPTAPAGPPPPPANWDVEFVRSTPAPGEDLIVAAPNDTPVELSVTFRVMVPANEDGDYNWNTAVMARHQSDQSLIYPVVITTFQRVSLDVGVDEITVSGFRTTNALCYQHPDLARRSLSLDIDVRDGTSSLGQNAPQVVGKSFELAWDLECQSGRAARPGAEGDG